MLRYFTIFSNIQFGISHENLILMNNEGIFIYDFSQHYPFLLKTGYSPVLHSSLSIFLILYQSIFREIYIMLLKVTNSIVVPKINE